MNDSIEITREEFEAAFNTKFEEPSLDTLIRRFQYGFLQSQGNEDAALAAVNELLHTAVDYDGFMARLRAA